MKKTSLVAAVALCASFVAGANATVIGSWQFNESGGTAIWDTTNSAGAGTWSVNLNLTDVSTTGAGALRIGYPATSGAQQIYAPLDGTYNTGIVEATVYINGWDFTGLTGVGPAFSFGFTNAESTSGSLVSRFGLFFNEAAGTTTVTFGGTGSTNARNIAAVPLAGVGLVRTEPIALRITLDYTGETTDTYSVAYDLGSGFQTLSSSAAEIDRDAIFAVFRASGNFSVAGSGLDIDRIEIAAIPEPGTVALLALGLGGMLLVGRRWVRA